MGPALFAMLSNLSKQLVDCGRLGVLTGSPGCNRSIIVPSLRPRNVDAFQ